MIKKNDAETGRQVGQHKPLQSDAHAEVAARSADGSQGMNWHKTLVLKGEFPAEHPIHHDNKTGVLQEALQKGLHPKGEVSLLNVEVTEPDRRRSVSTYATYSVEVQPASTDSAAEDVNRPGLKQK